MSHWLMLVRCNTAEGEATLAHAPTKPAGTRGGGTRPGCPLVVVPGKVP
jgi:hypothetical protein